MTNDYKYFDSERFRIAMTKRKTNIKNLSEELGYHRTQIHYMAGGWIPPEGMRVTIAKFLHEQPDDLWVPVVQKAPIYNSAKGSGDYNHPKL